VNATRRYLLALAAADEREHIAAVRGEAVIRRCYSPLERVDARCLATIDDWLKSGAGPARTSRPAPGKEHSEPAGNN
jgi:hypothetical protein